jgi:hypothetical protein
MVSDERGSAMGYDQAFRYRLDSCKSSRQQIPQNRQGHDQQHGKDGSAPDAVHSKTSYSNATPFGVILLKPCFRGVGVREHLQMLGVTDLLAGVDVDEDCHF